MRRVVSFFCAAGGLDASPIMSQRRRVASASRADVAELKIRPMATASATPAITGRKNGCATGCGEDGFRPAAAIADTGSEITPTVCHFETRGARPTGHATLTKQRRRGMTTRTWKGHFTYAARACPRKQPQERVLPDFRAAARTHVWFPQLQVTFHSVLRPDPIRRYSLSTVKCPNSIPARFRCIPQPHVA